MPICWWIFPNISRYLETRSRFSILLTTFVIALETLGMCLWSPFVLARPTPENKLIQLGYCRKSFHKLQFTYHKLFTKSFFLKKLFLDVKCAESRDKLNYRVHQYLPFSMVLAVTNSRHVLNIKCMATIRSTYRSTV